MNPVVTDPRDLQLYIEKGECLYTEVQLNEARKTVEDARIWLKWLNTFCWYFNKYGIMHDWAAGVHFFSTRIKDKSQTYPTIEQLEIVTIEQEEKLEFFRRSLLNMEINNENLYKHLHARRAKRLTQFENGFTPLNDYIDQGKLFP